MKWQKWTFRLLDTGFFRDGLPFNMGEGGYNVVRSIFPPHMTTFQGAIRTSLAAERGWGPGQEHLWPEELGSNDDLGNLRLRGPYIFIDGQPAFSAPLSVICCRHREAAAVDGEKEMGKYEFVRLKPGKKVDCDIGSVCLPDRSKSSMGKEELQSVYIKRSGLEALLAGGEPEDGEVVEKGRIWSEEYRTGLERDDDLRTAVEGKLYNIIHIRPERGVELIVMVAGIPEDWEINPVRVVNLGGEGRLAAVRIEAADLENIIPTMSVPNPAADGRMRFTVTLITPGLFDDSRQVIIEGPPGVPGRCVSACVGKAELLGGWDLVKGEPRPLVPILPAGCTWFFEVEEAHAEKVAALHGRCLGNRTEYGFGQVVIGKWEEDI